MELQAHITDMDADAKSVSELKQMQTILCDKENVNELNWNECNHEYQYDFIDQTWICRWCGIEK